MPPPPLAELPENVVLKIVAMAGFVLDHSAKFSPPPAPLDVLLEIVLPEMRNVSPALKWPHLGRRRNPVYCP